MTEKQRNAPGPTSPHFLSRASAVLSCFAAASLTLSAQVVAGLPTAIPAGEAPVGLAQGTDATPVSLASAAAGPLGPGSSSSLPEAPTPQLRSSGAPPTQGEQTHTVKPDTAVVPAGWQAPPLTARQKVVLGAKDLYSWEGLLAIPLTAGYEHITDGLPNYGTNSKAFAQRLGAAAARETSQGLFSEVILDPLFHEDPRYYVLGDSSNLVKRTTYAITRPFITRTDSGHKTINAALLVGYAGAAALTTTYYPQSNRNFHDVASVYGGSVGGAAIGFFVSEFADDVLEAVHLKRTP